MWPFGDLDTWSDLASVGAFVLALVVAAVGVWFYFRPPEPPAPPPEPGPRIVGVPLGRKVVGRERDVRDLRKALVAGSRTSAGSGGSGVVLKGQGGLGKSTLARRYVEVHGGDYHGGLWIHAGTRQAVIDGLMALCAPLGLEVPDTPREQHAQAVLRKVEASGKGWLFVYDNVEAFGDIKGLIPRGAHLIVTTRQGEGWPGWEVIETDVLGFASDDAPAVVLLMQEAERWDHAAEARALAEELGGLPLALVVAGALIKETGEGFAAYAGRLDEVVTHVPENEDYPTSVIGAVKLSYDKLERRCADGGGPLRLVGGRGAGAGAADRGAAGGLVGGSQGRDPQSGAGAGGGCGAGAGGVRRAGRAVADHPRGRRLDDAPDDGAGAARACRPRARTRRRPRRRRRCWGRCIRGGQEPEPIRRSGRSAPG